MKTTASQHGAILIIVLWFIAIATVIVATLASETRLSAQVVLYNKMGLQTWNDTLQALHAAQVELLINRMPKPSGEEELIPLSERKHERYRFDGQVLELAYPIPKTVKVRIYDHAGKINIHRLSKQRLRQLLEKRIGQNPEKMSALEDSWNDWLDSDEMKRVNGAEKDYYESLPTPYEPRNSKFETVEELLLIKGFDEVFKDVKMDSAFTVYGNTFGVNPNFATREALMLLPGLDSGSVDILLKKRRKKEFKSHADLNEFIEPEQLSQLRSWINFSSSNFYTIAIQPNFEALEKSEEDEEEETDEREEEDEQPPQSVAEGENEGAYMVIVQPRGYNELPKILRVNPYGVLPDTRHQYLSSDEEDEDDF
jgi:general secretion pathway protein K